MILGHEDRESSEFMMVLALDPEELFRLGHASRGSSALLPLFPAERLLPSLLTVLRTRLQSLVVKRGRIIGRQAQKIPTQASA